MKSLKNLFGIRRILLALLTAVVLPLSAFAQSDLPKAGTLPQGMESFDDVFPRLMAEGGIPGGAVVVAKDGRLVLARGYGWADRERRIPVDPFSHVFRLASLSKAITAVAILNLVETGTLKLDAPVIPLLSFLNGSDLENADPRLGTITVRHLLHHAGGWDVSKTFDPMFSGRMIAGELKTACPPSLQDTIRYMVRQPLAFSPGSAYAYSNFGYCLLGRVIEAVTGQSYETFVQQKILRPAGLTGFSPGKTLTRRPKEVAYFPVPSNPRGDSVFDSRPGKVEWPYGGWSLENMDAHGGWTATAVDMLRFVLALDGRLPGVRLLSPASYRTMLARPPAPLFAGEPFWYAMGLLVRPVQNDVNWWHLGSLDGTTSIMVRTHHGLAWVGLFNARPDRFDEFNGALDEAFWKAVEGVTSWPSGDLFQRR